MPLPPIRFILLALLSVVLWSFPAAAQNLGFEAGVWDGKAAYEEDGTFRHCMVARSFPNGATLFFAIDRRGLLTLAVHAPGLGLQPEKEYQATVSIDRRFAAKIGGVAVGETLLVLPLPNDEEMRGHLEGGYVLRFHSVEGATMEFPLDDTSTALPAVETCAQRNSQ